MSGWAAATSSYTQISQYCDLALRDCVRSWKTMYTHHCELIERPSILDVLERLLQILQLLIHNALGLLSALQSLGLKRINCLDLPCHIDSLGLEVVESPLNLVNDGGVLQNAAIVGEVDGLGLLAEYDDFSARIIIALLLMIALVSARNILKVATAAASPGAQQLHSGSLGIEKKRIPTYSDGHCDG
jgi:hypothetical protein